MLTMLTHIQLRRRAEMLNARLVGLPDLALAEQGGTTGLVDKALRDSMDEVAEIAKLIEQGRKEA